MVERIRIGKLDDGTEGMKITKPGYDITDPNPDNFLVHPSNYGGRVWGVSTCLTAVGSGPTTRMNATASNGFPAGTYALLQDYVSTFYHGFGYVPVFNVITSARSGDISHSWADTSYVYARVAPPVVGTVFNTFGQYFYQSNDQPTGQGYARAWYWDAASNTLRCDTNQIPNPTRIVIFRERLF